MVSMEEALRKSGLTLLRLGEALGIHNLDPASGLVFITGPQGVIGHRVAKRLLQVGYPQVRLGYRSPASTSETLTKELEAMSKEGAEIADFSWEHEETYGKALNGVKSVLCSPSYTKDWEKHFPNFLEACKKAGVKHFVKLSFYHARLPFDPFQEVPLVRLHGKCDRLVAESHPLVSDPLFLGANYDNIMQPPDMAWTILGASHFMSNPFVCQNQEIRGSGFPGTYYGASDNRGVNYVSPNDVAEVAVRVLLEPKAHYNKEYTLTGPEAITDTQVASLIAKHIKKPVLYVNQPIEEFMVEMRFSGEPAWMVQDLVAMERIKATGTEENLSFISKDFETICGHKPETFDEYLLNTDTMMDIEMGAPADLVPLKDPAE